MATGGQANEVSCPIREVNEISGHGLNACERQPGYQQSDSGRKSPNGHPGEVVSREESSIQESFACQLVNGQQQQHHYHQSRQASALSYPTQEMGVDASQRLERQQLRNPIEETAPSAERTPGEHEDLPPCHQHLSGADINGVSSTGEREHAVEHTCSRQELQLWRQESGRQADVTLACSKLSVVGDGEKGRAREKNEGGPRRGRKSSLDFSSLVFARPQLPRA